VIRPVVAASSESELTGEFGIYEPFIAEPGHFTELPPSVAVRMRRILQTLHSLAAPVPGGSR